MEMGRATDGASATPASAYTLWLYSMFSLSLSFSPIVFVPHVFSFLINRYTVHSLQQFCPLQALDKEGAEFGVV